MFVSKFVKSPLLSLSRSMSVYRLGKFTPVLPKKNLDASGNSIPGVYPGYFVAPCATVVGQVELEENVSVWYTAVIRGDNDLIKIGKGSNIQDAASTFLVVYTLFYYLIDWSDILLPTVVFFLISFTY